MNIIPSEIGHRIRSERLRLHYTQEAFSELLSIGRVHLANIEAGRKMASIDLLVAISETSGCSLDYLVLGKTTHNKDLKEYLLAAISSLKSACEMVK